MRRWLLALTIVGTLAGCSGPGITIKTTPENARVYVAEHFIGTTPIERYRLPGDEPPGTATLRVEKDGYETLELTITVPLPDDLQASFDLQPERAGAPASPSHQGP